MNEAHGNVQETVRRHYARQSLDEETLERLRAVAEGSGTPAGKRIGRRLFAPLAALLLLAGGVVILDSFAGGDDWRTHARRAAEHVAADHLQVKPVQFPSQTFGALSEVMEKLDFAPREPERLAEWGYVLKGARYCSVAGLVAAQIKLGDEQDESVTLYQFRPDERFSQVEECRFEVSGLEVLVWPEAGLVMVLARTAN